MNGPDFVLSQRRMLLDTTEFRRILALPRRTIPGDLTELTERMTALLRKPQGEMSLRPIQALALYEIGVYGGLFAPIRVGGGKTLTSLLAPFVLNAKRPVLLLPAALKDKTERARMQLQKHWRIGTSMRLISYEELGREKAAELLTFYRPDLIVGDEVHRLKNKRAGVTRRVLRYMAHDPRTKKRWADGERPKFVGMSGTMLKGGTIRSFAHLLKWSHDVGAPIPLDDGELEEWAACLDEDANFLRPAPGILLKLATDEERQGDPIKAARAGFHRRLVETPGVVSTAGEQVSCSLYIRGIPYKPNAATEENFRILRGTEDKKTYPGWFTPDGWPLSMAAEVWRVARELALGFHGIWSPRPPADWMNARKAWAAFVRETLSKSRTLDTELQVARACSRGELPRGAYDAWSGIKDTFRVNPKDVWHDDAALVACTEWLAKGPGICWVEHRFFGDELERRTGAPYFREQGLDKQGNSLDVLAELIAKGLRKPIPIIASVAANSTGRNLQPWSRNLLAACPSGAGTWEQLLGRTHRDGQEADAVECDVLIGCVENYESWANATNEAEMAVQAMGDSQKILIADVLDMTQTSFSGARWIKTRDRSD